jgi:hypothetical protein
VLGSARILRADLSPGFDGATVLVDPVTDWKTLQTSDIALAAAVADRRAAPAHAPIRWVDVPAGRVLLGLSDRDARAFAEWAAERSRAEAEQDAMSLKDRVALEELWGNPEHLLELLAFARPEHVSDLPAFSISAMPVSVADCARPAPASRRAGPSAGRQLRVPR